VGRVFGMVKELLGGRVLWHTLKRSEDRMKVHRRPFIYQAALSGNGLGCADDSGPNAQEPDEVNVSSPVLKQRRGQRWPRRL